MPSIASCGQDNPSARLWTLQRTKEHVKMSLKTTKGKLFDELFADKSSSLTGLLFALMSVGTDMSRDSNAVTG